MLAVISLILAAVIGFATHRASLCMVRAVMEILTSRRANMLASFLKTSLFAVAVAGPIVWFAPEAATVVPHYPVTLAALLGGVLFGVGAALNGGCSFSTLSYLARGDLSYAMTLGGFALAVALASDALPPAAGAVVEAPGTVALALPALALVWGTFEAARLWRTRPQDVGLWDLVKSPRYRLSSTALLLGVCAGTLATLHGPWTHTSALRRFEATPFHAALIVAILVGMWLSAWQQGALRLILRPSPVWLRRLGGGLLMGAGAAQIPGGNSWLVLRGIPSLSAHALPAFAAMMAGTALALIVSGNSKRVACTGDVCRTDEPQGAEPGERVGLVHDGPLPADGA